jgi:hypothetical protein
MALDDRTTELVAIGASITANCPSCREYHVGKSGWQHGHARRAPARNRRVRAERLDHQSWRLRPGCT